MCCSPARLAAQPRPTEARRNLKRRLKGMPPHRDQEPATPRAAFLPAWLLGSWWQPESDKCSIQDAHGLPALRGPTNPSKTGLTSSLARTAPKNDGDRLRA